MIHPLPTTDQATVYLQDSVYLTLLLGITALAKEKPEDPVVILMLS